MVMSPSFSERYGYKPLAPLELEAASEQLRNSIWNVIATYYVPDDETFVAGRFQKFLKSLYIHSFKLPVDHIDEYVSRARETLMGIVSAIEWFDLFDLVEFLLSPSATRFMKSGQPEELSNAFNYALKLNRSGYRVLNQKIVPITDETELSAISEALELPDGYALASEHIKTALALYSDKKTPDYRNAVKEAISAVESATRVATGESKTGVALKELVASFKLHPALAEAFNKLYGFTSDGGGIRHALIQDSDVDAPLAKFMIVACSAFVSYTVEKLSQQPQS
jgi:hypothetical protein